MADKLVHFLHGESRKFNSLTETGQTDAGTIYIIDDTREIYKGSNRVAIGKDKIHVGTDAPTDPDVIVWVDPDGEATNIKGEDGKDGTNGTDGVSCTHSWNGTTLTVTSANGTTSADLKGDKGDKGADGYTPVKGTDYFTETDKAEIITQVLDTINGSSVFGYVDEDNNIVLTGNLADGTYSLKYEMEDGTQVDIGDMVLNNNVYYSVTNNLTNCTNGNSESEVISGESYSATISANDGYTLSSVSVTMDGTDITSSAVNGGTINIASVTGDIVITAIADVVTESVVNLIPTLTDIDLTTIYNGVGYKEDVRISVSNVSTSNPSGEKTQADTTLLGLMPLGDDGDILHLRGAAFCATSSSYSGLIWYYDASGTLLNTGTINIATMGLIGTDANGDATFTLTHSKMSLIDGTAYIRFNIANPTGELIMTRNQLIPVE